MGGLAFLPRKMHLGMAMGVPSAFHTDPCAFPGILPQEMKGRDGGGPRFSGIFWLWVCGWGEGVVGQGEDFLGELLSVPHPKGWMECVDQGLEKWLGVGEGAGSSYWGFSQVLF